MYTNYSYSMSKSYHSTQLPKTFPEDIQCIIWSKNPDAGSLYISNVQAASNPHTLKKHKITAVLSCAKGYQLKHPKTIVPHYKYIPTVDQDECDISIHFDEAVNFIKQTLKHTNVLAHCIAGVSRSVSMVIAYFIKEHSMHYEQAYRLVKSKRKIIHPNDGFIRQLKHYSDTLKKQQANVKKLGFSPRVLEHNISFQKEQNLYKTMTDFKTIQTSSQNRELTPQKSLKDGTYQKRYAETTYKNPNPPITQNYIENKQPISQSMPYIPDPEQPHNKQSPLTPKASKQQSYQMMRTSTNYFTPNRTLVNQKPYENVRKYQGYNRSVRIQKPTTTSIITNKSPVSPIRPNQITTSQTATIRNTKNAEETNTKGDFFASKDAELNEKIDMIRKKYAAQRQKLFNKYQSPQKLNQQKVDQYKTVQKRRVSLGEYNAQKPSLSKKYDQQQKKYNIYNTDVKRQELNRGTGFQYSNQLYSKKYQNMVGSPKLNQEESSFSKIDFLRNNVSQTTQKTVREYDRYGGLSSVYSSYSPYYKYQGSHKRYY